MPGLTSNTFYFYVTLKPYTKLEIVKASENMVIIEPNVTFGDVEIGPGESATSIDTCTFQVDRSKAIDPDQIVWRVRCQRADTGMPIELTCAGLLQMMARLVLKIWQNLSANGCGQALPGGVPEDIIKDGTVNLVDFARLAQNWTVEK